MSYASGSSGSLEGIAVLALLAHFVRRENEYVQLDHQIRIAIGPAVPRARLPNITNPHGLNGSTIFRVIDRS